MLCRHLNFPPIKDHDYMRRQTIHHSANIPTELEIYILWSPSKSIFGQLLQQTKIHCLVCCPIRSRPPYGDALVDTVVVSAALDHTFTGGNAELIAADIDLLTMLVYFLYNLMGEITKTWSYKKEQSNWAWHRHNCRMNRRC